MKSLNPIEHRSATVLLIGVAVGVTINSILSSAFRLTSVALNTHAMFLSGLVLDFLSVGLALFLLMRLAIPNRKETILIPTFFSLVDSFPLFLSLGINEVVFGGRLERELLYQVLQENAWFLIGHWASNLVAAFLFVAVLSKYPLCRNQRGFKSISGLLLVLVGSSVAYSVAYLFLVADPIVIWGYAPQKMNVNYATLAYGSVVTVVALVISVLLLSALLRRPSLGEAISISLIFRLLASLTPTVTIIRAYLGNIFPVSVILKEITFHGVFVGVNLCLGFLVVWLVWLFFDRFQSGMIPQGEKVRKV